MTYNVFSGTLNLTQSINLSFCRFLFVWAVKNVFSTKQVKKKKSSYLHLVITMLSSHCSALWIVSLGLCVQGDEEDEEMLPPYQDDHTALLRRPEKSEEKSAEDESSWGPGTSRQSKTTSRTYTDPDGNVITEVCIMSRWALRVTVAGVLALADSQRPHHALTLTPRATSSLRFVAWWWWCWIITNLSDDVALGVSVIRLRVSYSCLCWRQAVYSQTGVRQLSHIRRS